MTLAWLQNTPTTAQATTAALSHHPRPPARPPSAGQPAGHPARHTAAARRGHAVSVFQVLGAGVPLLYGLLLLALLTGCGGGDNPLDNPPAVDNPASSGGRKLSFEYFQRCVNPILLSQVVSKNGTSTCASGGCHSDATGTGGALRIRPLAPLVDMRLAANTPDAVRNTDMYRNFYSSQGVTLVGDPDHSRLVNKPLVIGTLHGGGLIFDSAQDEAIRRLRYWITRTMPEGQDEFGSAAASLFTPADPQTGACNAE